jgi:hypothetical protein
MNADRLAKILPGSCIALKKVDRQVKYHARERGRDLCRGQPGFLPRERGVPLVVARDKGFAGQRAESCDKADPEICATSGLRHSYTPRT